MRVLVDTNVVLSAILFAQGGAAKAFVNVVENHHLVLSDYTISELYDVFERKFHDKLPALDSFLDTLTYETVKPSARMDPTEYPGLRDPDDLPILVSAKEAKCDCLLSGDKDLQSLTSTPIRIVSPAEFIELTK